MTEEGSYPPDHLEALKQDRRANAGREGYDRPSQWCSVPGTSISGGHVAGGAAAGVGRGTVCGIGRLGLGAGVLRFLVLGGALRRVFSAVRGDLVRGVGGLVVHGRVVCRAIGDRTTGALIVGTDSPPPEPSSSEPTASAPGSVAPSVPPSARSPSRSSAGASFSPAGTSPPPPSSGSRPTRPSPSTCGGSSPANRGGITIPPPSMDGAGAEGAGGKGAGSLGAGAEGAGAEGAGADCAGTDGDGFDGVGFEKPGTLIRLRRGWLDELPGSEEPVDSVAVRTTGTATVSASDVDAADPADPADPGGGVSAWATIPAADAGSTLAPPASAANAAAAGGTAAASGGGASLAAAGAGMTAVPRPSGGTPTLWSPVLTVPWLTSPTALVPMTALRARSAPAVMAMPWAVPPDSSLRTSRARGTTGRSIAWEARRPSRRSRAPTEIGPSYETWAGYETVRARSPRWWPQAIWVSTGFAALAGAP